jgi:uncharacterized membrane protein YdjX (TVP38/TMEM64 family)
VLVGAGVLAVAWAALRTDFVSQLFDSGVSAEVRLASLKSFFARFGVFAPLVYIGLVVIEVIVAPLPGVMLYAPGGIIFGAIPGGFYSLVGNVVGAGLACRLMRWLGRKRIRGIVEQRELQKYERQLESHGVLVVFLLRVNPLTSSDIVSYAAGLTPIPVWKVMAGTLVGMAPLCFLQAWLADELLTRFPQLLYPLVVVCVVYVGIVIWFVRRMRAGQARAESDAH